MPLTFDDVWKMFQETDRKFQKTDRKFQETQREIQDLKLMLQETDRQMQLNDQRLSAKIAAVSKLIGNLGGRWGDFVEGLVAPACETLFAQRGIPVHKVSRRVKAKLPDGRSMEIDVMVENTDTVALVEVKSELTVEDVKTHLIRLSECKIFLPGFVNKQVIGAVAGIVIDQTADLFAMKQGLFVMIQSGDTMRMANDADFLPRTW